MNTDPPAGPAAPAAPAAPPPAFAPTPWSWRLGLAAAVVGLTGLAYALHGVLGPRGQAACGVVAFFGLAAAFSANLRAVNWRTDRRRHRLADRPGPAGTAGEAVSRRLRAPSAGGRQFIDFSDKGAEFVFGNLAHPGDMALNPGSDFLFLFAFVALPPIIFVSAFFTVLYHFGVLQWVCGCWPGS